MRSYQPVHQQNTIDEISQRAKGTHDNSALIEKRLGNIESKFQGVSSESITQNLIYLSQLEDRLFKIEAALREVRAEGHSHKDDRYGAKTSFDDLQSFKVAYYTMSSSFIMFALDRFPQETGRY